MDMRLGVMVVMVMGMGREEEEEVEEEPGVLWRDLTASVITVNVNMDICIVDLRREGMDMIRGKWHYKYAKI